MERPLSQRIARHADLLADGGRSPLYVELMRGAARSVADGGAAAAVFDGTDSTRGSVPALRLMAALHHLVLEGSAPELAAYFPDAGGDLAPAGAWAVAERVIAEQPHVVRARTGRPVQTNDPGRSVVLYGALLWLGQRFALPVRLREIGASSGLNLIPDRYAYVVAGETLGATGSPVRFVEPWVGRPVVAASSAAAASGLVRVADRAGCDLDPIDLAEPDGRMIALSYMWPDEPERLERMRAAIDLYVTDPAPVALQPASQWLAGGAATPSRGALTVVWQSVVRQYLPDEEWRAVQDELARAGATATPDAPLAWVTLEGGPPTDDRASPFELACTLWPGGERTVLGRAGFHGAPVKWASGA